MALLLVASSSLDAQRGRGGTRGSRGVSSDYRGYIQGGDLNDINNVPYDGRLTIARIRYEPMGGGESFFGRDLKWDHDIPRGEQNFMKILNELTLIRPYLEQGNIYAADDPQLMKYPIAYLCEAGFWSVNEKEAAGLRNYMMKGGFIMFDDFGGPHWYNFEQQIRKVLPQVRLIPLDSKHPIFDSFFHIDPSQLAMQTYYQERGMGPPEYYGIFQDNDPKKRMMAIVNYNNDISEYWEFSGSGLFPIALSNEAYKLGVNYVMYALTH
jgi:hypothetical protein